MEKKITDFDLAIDIVNDAIRNVHADMRVHGADDTYEAIANVLYNVRREMVRVSDTIYEIGA